MKFKTDPENPHHDPTTFTYQDLPDSADDDAKVKLTIIHQGYLETLPSIMSCDIHDPPEIQHQNESKKFLLPIYGWLIEKTTSDGEIQRYLWDLGQARELPPSYANQKLFKPVVVEGALLPEQLHAQKPAIDPDSLKGIILSHCHMDHYGNMNLFDPKVPIYVGPGTNAWVNGGDQAEHGLKSFPSRFLEKRKLVEVEGQWKPVASFERGVDWFGDGSLWLIDSPGHCAGHLVALARVSTSPATYILLAGDAAHSARVYQPVPPPDLRSRLGTMTRDGEVHYMFDDVPTAYETIGRITRIHMDDKVMVVAAHETEVEKTLNLKPGEMRGGIWEHWREEGLKEKKAPVLPGKGHASQL